MHNQEDNEYLSVVNWLSNNMPQVVIDTLQYDDEEFTSSLHSENIKLLPLTMEMNVTINEEKVEMCLHRCGDKKSMNGYLQMTSNHPWNAHLSKTLPVNRSPDDAFTLLWGDDGRKYVGFHIPDYRIENFFSVLSELNDLYREMYDTNN